MKCFGERLKALRNENNLSQADFAQKFNKSKQTISNYETGERQPDLEMIAAFANFFNVSTDYLLCLSDFKNNESKSFIELSPHSGDIKNNINCINELNTAFEHFKKLLNLLILRGNHPKTLITLNMFLYKLITYLDSNSTGVKSTTFEDFRSFFNSFTSLQEALQDLCNEYIFKISESAKSCNNIMSDPKPWNK